jgi:Zn-dependent protease with chaperone function
MRISFYFTFLIYFIAFPVYSQSYQTYVPVKNDSLYLAGIKKEIKQKYLKDSASITGENKKYIIELYHQRFNSLNERFTVNEFISTPEINNYLTSLVNEILKVNPELKTLGTRFLFSKAYWPNAYSTGEGTIVINIGLFTKLDNESQLVFALCHELSHLYLNHSNKAIDYYINTLYSDEFQAKLKALKKKEFEKNKELDKLEKGVVFTGRRHGRQHESEADSMALVFMKNTHFDVSASIGLLKILDNIDKDTYNTEEGLRTVFNSPDFPFQNKWIKQEEAFFGVTKESDLADKETDSLKTHPDCKLRITRLNPIIEKLKIETGIKNKVNQLYYDSLKKLFSFEIVEYCFKMDDISRCLYQAMELYKQYPEDAYLTTMIGKCFNAMYTNQKNHTLYQIVTLPSALGEKNYNTLLEFIQHIKLQEIAGIGYFFLKQHEARFTTDKDFTLTFNQSKKNLNPQ